MREWLFFALLSLAAAYIPEEVQRLTTERTTTNLQQWAPVIVHIDNATEEAQAETCDIQKNWSRQERCLYVGKNSDACEGGGYFPWSNYVECEENTTRRVFIIIGGVFYMFLMFLFVSSTADDFFSPNIAGIVSHLRIKESIAGVTLMAFGNGSSDIFSSVASILSSPAPKAGLALGTLLGGCIFITSIVVAAIILVKPFKVDWFGTTRDLIFFLIGVGFILFVFLHSTTIYVFEPAVFLGLYGLYVFTVVVIQGFIYGHIKKWLKARRQSDVECCVNSVQGSIKRQISIIGLPDKDKSYMSGLDNLGFDRGDSPTPSTGSSVTLSECQDDEDSFEDVVLGIPVHAEEERSERLEETVSDSDELEDDLTWTWSDVVWDIFNHCNPIPDKETWTSMGIFKKLHCIISIPVTIILKITIPHCESKWSKPVLIIHLLCAPQLFIFAIHTIAIIHKGPGLYIYILAISLILILLVLIFTSMRKAPRFYKEFYAYSGFIMSIGWIYFTCSEVVGVVTMIGVISGLSNEFLGLTIIAWSNSLGDLVADPAVAKQGMPRMALGAAIGGPLFNLLVGFGLPFTIATAQGKPVTIAFTATLRFLVLFLLLSLSVTLAAIYIQRLVVRRYHAFTLIAIYGTFILFIILTEAKVIKWGPLA